jgi:PAS domain S-box-containing protein
VVVLRYGLAFSLVAIALTISVIPHFHNSPPRFVSHFVLLAIAITFWCAGTGPGLFALLLSCLGVSFLATNHFLTPDFPLASFLSFFVIFSLLMSWFAASRHRAQQLLIEARNSLELRVAERTGELVTANKELQSTQAELESRGEYLAKAQRLSRTGSFGWKVSTREVLWSDETYRILGYPPETKPTLQLVFERIHPEDRDQVEEIFERGAQNGMDLDFEHRFLMLDGSIKNIHTVAHAVRDASGDLEYIGAATDITDRKRAEDKLRKAFEEIKDLRDELHQENLALKEEIDQASMFEEIVGCSDALRRVLIQVEKVAPTDSTVLITGETGTGKELVARAIHKRSNRADHVFISVNCASIPSSLIASELFGHEKGAFTGALQRHQGRFELAHSGTIFLDEVGELPAETQIALLRVLQERQFERVGGNRVLETDIRVIAATNRDLADAIADGTFRADLFYRLNVVPIEVPPLRRRRDDIPLLVEYFVKRYAAKAGKKFNSIRKKTLELFETYDWPGNVRELQNVIERAVVLSNEDTFLVPESWLKPALRGQTEQPSADINGARTPLVANLIEREKDIIERALREAEGVVGGPTGAAVRLGIPRETLNSKIRRLGIKRYLFRRS